MLEKTKTYLKKFLSVKPFILFLTTLSFVGLFQIYITITQGIELQSLASHSAMAAAGLSILLIFQFFGSLLTGLTSLFSFLLNSKDKYLTLMPLAIWLIPLIIFIYL